MRYLLLITCLISVACIADEKSLGRWIIQLEDEQFMSTQQVDELLQTQCEGMTIKSLKAMGLKQHYVLAVHASQRDIKCIEGLKQVKRLERDQVMRALGNSLNTIQQP